MVDRGSWQVFANLPLPSVPCALHHHQPWEPTRMSTKWDTRFLGLAAHISAWSKDPSSQVGAVITDGNRIVSLGYNGFAAGVIDAEERLSNRDIKLNLTIHAEENAMIFAKRDLTGCTVYVTHPPCPRCASKLIQEEVSRIVCIAPSEDFLSRWSEDLELSRQMYREAGIEFQTYEVEQINIETAQVTVAPGGFFRKVMTRCLEGISRNDQGDSE